jgi:hypothetical protein
MKVREQGEPERFLLGGGGNNGDAKGGKDRRYRRLKVHP